MSRSFHGVRIVLLFAVCSLLLGLPALAHELATARLGLVEEGAGAYRLTAKLGAGTPVAVTPDLPAGCAFVDTARRPTPGGLQVHEWRLTCADRVADGEIGLPLGVEDATVVTRNRAGTEHTFQMRAQDGRIVLSLAASLAEGQSALDLARRQVELGIGHILSGFDHLALLLCLCLVASGWTLVRLITGFTVGHSLTLALATLGWVSFPAPLIEALIALSIAFLAPRGIDSGALFGARVLAGGRFRASPWPRLCRGARRSRFATDRPACESRSETGPRKRSDSLVVAE